MSTDGLKVVLIHMGNVWQIWLTSSSWYHLFFNLHYSYSVVISVTTTVIVINFLLLTHRLMYVDFSADRHDSVDNCAIASDGSYLYILNRKGLVKMGSGYGGTIKVCAHSSHATHSSSSSVSPSISRGFTFREGKWGGGGGGGGGGFVYVTVL